MSDSRQPANGNDVDFARLRQAVDEVDTEAQVRHLLSPEHTQERYAEWLAQQEQARTQMLFDTQAADLHTLHNLISSTTAPYPPAYPAPGLPYIAMPAPPPVYVPGEFTYQAISNQLAEMDVRTKRQKRLIYAQIVLLVLWVILQAVSIVQRSGRFG